MMSARAACGAVLGFMLATSVLQGQTGTSYRDFRLGGDVASVSALASLKPSDAKTLHTRPALLQDLEWQRPFTLGDEKVGDPAQRITFSFYNDQLFRLVIDYDRNRTQGLTDADLIEAISTMYGAPLASTVKPARAALPAGDAESGAKIASWGNGEYTAVLQRAPYGTGFRMVVASVRLGALARTAEAQALQLDERDAPQRELARHQQEADDARAVQEKARLANKATFTP